MAKLYFRYGQGKTSDLCQTAYNFNERNKNVIIINADNNKKIEAKVEINGKQILTRDINFELNSNESLFSKIYNLNLENVACILVDNAHLLNREQANDLFYIATLLNITVITYGSRIEANCKSTEGAMRLMELANIIEPVDGQDIVAGTGIQFYYGAMNCSKTAKLLYKSYSLEKGGYTTCVIKPKLDRDEKKVGSRIGLSRDANVILDGNDELEDYLDYIKKCQYILVDEAQFLTVNQINELNEIAKKYNISTRCYGLKTDFMTNHFSGSGRLLEISNQIIKLKTVCPCGEGAEFNARRNSNGEYVKKGEQISVDNGQGISYISLCPKCYIKDVLEIDSPKKLVK